MQTHSIFFYNTPIPLNFSVLRDWGHLCGSFSMQPGPKLSTQIVIHHSNQEYKQKLILVDQNNIPDNYSRGIRVWNLVVEQRQQPPRIPTDKGTEENGTIWERKGLWEFGENVGNQKMEREWELMVMKWGDCRKWGEKRLWGVMWRGGNFKGLKYLIFNRTSRVGLMGKDATIPPRWIVTGSTVRHGGPSRVT